jgi:RNA polymerase sigma-70 factor (ECF subfamily)
MRESRPAGAVLHRLCNVLGTPSLQPRRGHITNRPHAAIALPERGVPDERALLDRLRSHDEKAFADLVDAHSSWMLRTARVSVRSRAVAEEVVQETWLNALRALDRFEGRSTFKTWLFTILVNTAKRHAVRENRSASFSDLARDPQEHDPDPLDALFFDAAHPRWPHSWTSVMPAWNRLPEERLLSRELRTTVEAAVETLPDGQRTVFSLRDLDHWTAEEVCNALAISDSNQRVLLHRARLNMRAALERYFDGERT